jgi:protein-L-isoaspartate O-methyltransferase
LAQVSGTEGYAEEAEALIKQYKEISRVKAAAHLRQESVSFADVHEQVLHLIPTVPGRVLDIGSGTGRDAAAFAAMGHHVIAVEPTGELRA